MLRKNRLVKVLKFAHSAGQRHNGHFDHDAQRKEGAVPEGRFASSRISGKHAAECVTPARSEQGESGTPRFVITRERDQETREVKSRVERL